MDQSHQDFLLEEFSIESRQAVRLDFNRRMAEICGMPHANIRASIYVAAMAFAAAQAMYELEGAEVAAATLRRLADGMDKVQ